MNRWTILSVAAWCCGLSALADGPEPPTGATQPAGPAATQPASGTPSAEKLGLRLGLQTYSLRHMTFFEAVDKAAECGIRHVEAYPGQKVSPQIAMNVGPGLPDDVRQKVKDKLASAGVRLACFGVTGIPGEEKAARRVFEFAKDMGIETIVSEPAESSFELLDKLTEEYGITVAIHNHPKPTHYWDPAVVLKACQGHSKKIGACGDTKHWMSSKLDPVACLRQLEGRIVSLHFGNRCWDKDEPAAKAVLAELVRQKLSAVLSIEYEWARPEADIAKAVAGVEKICAELLAEESGSAD